MNDEKKEETAEDIKKDIYARMGINSRVLHIGRVPLSTFTDFTAWAKEEFCDDYGMGFRHLWDCYMGLIPTGIEHIEAKLDALEIEVNALKALLASKKEEEKVIRMADGKVLRRD